MPGRSRLLLHRLCALALLAPGASADVELAGFGTLGGAISDQDFTYQRDITDTGTLDRDSLIGLQLDARLSGAWWITLQAKAAPADDRENGWDPTLTWAFVSWRPTNELLLRLGKLRMPLMLYSATSDVGTTYPFARLPAEVYSLAPVIDVQGLSFSWNWSGGDQEWTLDGYGGRTRVARRFWIRDGLPPNYEPGALYEETDVDLGGLVLTLHQGDHTWRLGLHRVEVLANAVDFPQTYPWVQLGPGVGYYQMPGMPGPGVPTVGSLANDILTLSADIGLPNDVRLIGEYARRRVTNATTGLDTQAGYLALLRPIAKWTPYVYVAGIRSDRRALDLYQALDRNQVPAVIPNAAVVNAAQRLGADRLAPYDQYTLAIGTSYRLTPNSMFKVEWAHARSGVAPTFIDVPAGEDGRDREVDVFSLVYSLTF